MNKLSKAQNLNYLAVSFLEKLGNITPSQHQVELMESLISKVVIEKKLYFDHKLTERETACLLLAAKGRTATQIADMLNLKISTIKSHRKKIIRKLACTSMAQAVFEGIRYGYIQPTGE